MTIDGRRYNTVSLAEDGSRWGTTPGDPAASSCVTRSVFSTQVCIGDRYRIGGAEFEVTQPRVTCYRVGIRMNEPRMPALLVEHHRPGFYFRVLQEGEVGADDDIVKITDGPERISVAEVDALLYLPGHSSDQLQRALRIPALSKGWQSSFQAMLQQDLSSKTTVGNPGLATEEQAPAWPGFRQMRVARIQKESDSVTSFVLAPIDGQPLPVFQAGQFVVLRLLSIRTNRRFFAAIRCLICPEPIISASASRAN